MSAPDITNTSGRCIMSFPEAFKFIEETAPHKETHHPKCSYRQAGMLCDCSIIWAEYHKRRANQAEERERVLRDALEKQNKFLFCDEDADEYPTEGCKCEACTIQRLVDAALATPAPEQPSICPDCRSVRPSSRGLLCDAGREWRCDDEWHEQPAQPSAEKAGE